MINEHRNQDELEDKKVLSIHQLCFPFLMHNDFNRIQMASSQITQALPIVNSEPPRAYSIYNPYMVKYSDMITEAKSDVDVLGKVKLYDEEFLLILSETELELIPITHQILGSAFTAYNTYVTNKKKVKKGQPLVINGNSDEYGNLQFGLNALVGYKMEGDNFEDSVILSESFAKKLVHVERSVVEFIVNDNEFLLNLWGDDNNYECFPKIGSYIDKKSRIICAKRYIKNGWKSFMELSKKSTQKINFYSGDDVFYGKGKIVDISVFSNLNDKKDEQKNDFFKKIEEYINKNKDDIKNFLNLIEPFVKRYKDKNDVFDFGPNLQYYYNRYKKIDNNNVLTLNDKKFNGLLVRITLEDEVPAVIGTKICNTHGGKSVVTIIRKDDDMPKRKCDGKPLDVIFSPNSVIGRINLGQIHETTLNRIAEEVFNEFKNIESNDDKMKLYIDFMKDLLPERLHDQLVQLEKLKGKKLDEFVNSVLEQGFIYVPQVPMETIHLDKFKKWYNKYGLENDAILQNGKECNGNILTGYQYILKLLHIPNKKMSACSVRKLGTKTLKPIKDNSDYKKHKVPISFSPNTIGEQELSILMALSNNMNLLKELIFLKSSDIKNRKLLLNQLLMDETDISISDYKDLRSISMMNLEYYLNTIGLTLKS